MNTVGLLSWLIIASLGTVLFAAVMILFGRLIKLQIKVWFLAKRGFHLIEHIGTNRVRSYFYLRPQDNKFDFKSGFYLHYPETTTKAESFMPKTPGGYKFSKISDLAETDEGERLRERINKLIYDNSAVTLRWGIPIITYVGNSPYPINFQEPDKEYGAQVIRDVYIRLLATEQYGLMKKIMMIGLILFGVIAVALILLYMAYKSNSGNMAVCLANLNSTAQNLVTCTAQMAAKAAIPVGPVPI
jgi:hypothetical protein